MRPVPYIGITGISTNQQFWAVAKAHRNRRYPYLMEGLLVSHKSLRGEPAKFPERYPRNEELCTVFALCSNTINLVHFNTNEPGKLLDQMLEVDELVGPYCNGFQLNIAWPDPATLERYLSRRIRTPWRGKPVIVLQCGRAALEEYDRNPKKIAQVVAGNYEGLVDYVLIDSSGGKGEEFNTAFANECLSELFANCPSIGPGIAGGLSADNIQKQLGPLFKELPEPFSIDAEGRLRDERDWLDLEKCGAYIKEAMKFYST